MVEITVMSGKGGTGKTSISASFATLARDPVCCDNDVDASNLHLILNPRNRETHVFRGGYLASVDQDLCTGCGICSEACRFEAISFTSDSRARVHPEHCEGCRLCERLCPENAISSSRSESSKWFVGDTRCGALVYARLGPGEENSGKLITEIRRAAREIAERQDASILINDGPPGIGCAAISSITGTGMVVIVTEPSASGMHDAGRLVSLVEHFGIPMAAIINKYDLSPAISGQIERFFREKEIPVIARIDFDVQIVKASLYEQSIVEYDTNSKAALAIASAWKILGDKFLTKNQHSI